MLFMYWIIYIDLVDDFDCCHPHYGRHLQGAELYTEIYSLSLSLINSTLPSLFLLYGVLAISHVQERVKC